MTEHDARTENGDEPGRAGPTLPPMPQPTLQPKLPPELRPEPQPGLSPKSHLGHQPEPQPRLQPGLSPKPHPGPQPQSEPHPELHPRLQTEAHSELHPELLPEVPFLELADGRLQGVISSESHPERVYASSISTGDHGLSCRSNDDLRCGGLSEAAPCRHIEALLAQAVKEFGAKRVALFLGIEVEEGQGLCLHPTSAPSHATEVFASFMRHMAYLEVPVRDTQAR